MATVKDVRKFKDIDLSFKVNPFTKDIYLKQDEEAVKTALRHLILTKNFERPFHPEVGTQVTSLLFENFSPSVRIAMEKTIEDAILKFEPRVKLNNISILELQDGNTLEVTINFTLRNVNRPVTLTTLLTRVR
jgi:phage baseplate assembly protein W